MPNSLRIKEKRGPKTPEGRARALANLKPAKLGEVRNPDGRPPAGASVREWLNSMQDWPRTRIKTVMNDPSAPVAKCAAARCWLDASENGYTSSGAPIAGSDFDRICDRTEGKPQENLAIRFKENPNVGATGIDYSLLTNDELAAIESILEQAAQRCRDN